VGRRSVGLYARELHHLAPLLGFVRDQPSEVGRRTYQRDAAEVGETCPEWLREQCDIRRSNARTFAVCGTLEWRGWPATLAGVACSSPGGTEAIVTHYDREQRGDTNPEFSIPASTFSIRPRMDVRLPAAASIVL
jgi:hypothetical protein